LAQGNEAFRWRYETPNTCYQVVVLRTDYVVL